MHKKADLRTDIQILRATGPLLGFKVLKLDQLLPELFELGELREAANHRSVPAAPPYSTASYVVEGTNQIVFENGQQLALNPGSVTFVPPHCNHARQYGPEPKHRVLWVGFELSAVATRHPDWNLMESLRRVHFAHDSTHLERCFLRIIREATTPSVHRTCGLRLALDTLLLEIVRDIVEPSKISSLISIHRFSIEEARRNHNATLWVVPGSRLLISHSAKQRLFARSAQVTDNVQKRLPSNASISELAHRPGPRPSPEASPQALRRAPSRSQGQSGIALYPGTDRAFH